MREGRISLLLDPSLSGFQVRSWSHSAGRLLALSSSRHPDPLVVRVIGPQPQGVGGALLVSAKLFTLLGSDATLLPE